MISNTPDVRQLILNIQPEAPPAFDNFRPGDNLETLLALHTLASGEWQENIVYLWGGVGSGRSHLLQATVAEACAQGIKAAYSPSASPLPDLLPPLLAVDDVDALDEDGQIRLFSLINQAREGQGVVLAAGNLPPAQLSLRMDLATRLGWGLIFALHPLNEADRAKAVQERAMARGVELADEVVRYLLTHGRRDLPSLLASVDALDVYSLSLKRPITVPLVREWRQLAKC